MTQYVGNGTRVSTGGGQVGTDPGMIGVTNPKLPPVPTGGGAAPNQQGPQAGDVDPTTGNRWSADTNSWLPPNFFSDLNPGYGQNGGGQGGGGGNSGGTGGGMGKLPAAPGAPGGIPVQGGGVGGLQLPDQLYQFIPENVRGQFAQTLQSFLRGLGYTGQGNVGQYGERSYVNSGQNPNWLDPSIFGSISDPTLQGWVKWLFGERGLSPRVEQPGATAQGTPSDTSTGATAGSKGILPVLAGPTLQTAPQPGQGMPSFLPPPQVDENGNPIYPTQP